MCIGGHYTMDRFDAVEAAKFVGADLVIPCHYNTFPPIATDAEAFKTDVQGTGAAEVIVLDPGGTHAI
jgi:L-ascorbate metabolism protein UlaG (beta-lactamase superfamily)